MNKGEEASSARLSFLRSTRLYIHTRGSWSPLWSEARLGSYPQLHPRHTWDGHTGKSATEEMSPEVVEDVKQNIDMDDTKDEISSMSTPTGTQEQLPCGWVLINYRITLLFCIV